MGGLDPTEIAAGFATIATADAAFPLLSIAIGSIFALWLLFQAVKRLMRQFNRG